MDVVSYNRFIDGVKEIADRVSGFDIDSIYGIPRGGHVVAVYLSHLLNLPVVKTPRRRTLIVDDIADTGETLTPYREYKIATLYYHKQSKVLPDVWVFEKTDDWVLFPWENYKSTKRKL